MSITYNVVFLIEFLLLVIGHGVIEHFTSAEWAWHLFDAVVVFFGVVEVVLFTLQQGGEEILLHLISLMIIHYCYDICIAAIALCV